MTWSEKEKQSYKLGHNRLINRTSRFKDISIKNKRHVHCHSRVFFMSPGIEVNILVLIIHKNF